MFVIFILVMVNVVDMFSCFQYYMGFSNVMVGMEMEGSCLENFKYYNYVVVLFFIVIIMLVQVSYMVKFMFMLFVVGVVVIINFYVWCFVFDEYDYKCFWEYDLFMVVLEQM